MYRDRLRDQNESKLQARRQVGALLDINPATLGNWVEREEIDTGLRPGHSTEESVELRALKKENAELRRAGEILKTAQRFSLRRSSTAEPICRVLTEHDMPIAPSTFYAVCNRSLHGCASFSMRCAAPATSSAETRSDD